MEAWAKAIIVFMFGFFMMFLVPYFPIQNDLTIPLEVILIFASAFGCLFILFRGD